MAPRLVTQILGGLIRLALASVFTWLISKGVIAETDIEAIVAGITGLAVVAGWTAWQKIRAWEWLQAALDLPAGSTVDDVHEASGRGAYPPPLPAIVALAVLSMAVACASLPLKQRVSQTHQTVREAIVAVDEAERLLCGPMPAPNENRCASPTAAAIGLTDAKHQAISRTLAQAYEADVRVGAAIVAWRAGDPPPADLDALLARAQETLSVAATVADSTFASKAQTLVARAQRLVAAFQE